MASSVNPITSAITGSNASSSASSGSSSTSGNLGANEETFLTLLVSQLQNQDPLNPTDSTQFVAELAQFSELEQVMAIRSDIEQYHAQATATTSGSVASQNGSTQAGSTAGSGQN